jgi:hypothetical protein
MRQEHFFLDSQVRKQFTPGDLVVIPYVFVHQIYHLSNHKDHERVNDLIDLQLHTWYDVL